ncbi:DUF4879 domain-containing protein [Bacillus sp. A301a_S52]|jgi:hypothetical protein|nr:DUF4879 domain-containing protein [Bacillus sp. A301a_S52]
MFKLAFRSRNLDSVEAGPAPPLTYMNIDAITSDGGGFEWHYPDQEYMSTGYTASGSEIYIVTHEVDRN